MDQFSLWLEINQHWLKWAGIGSLSMVLLSLIIVPIAIVRMQPDYFLENRDESKSLKEIHPVLRIAGKTLKNIAGGLLVIGGILLSLPLIPGQGLLTILIGVAVMDFPGKRRLELWMVRKRPVEWAIARLREKANRPPLILPADQ